MAALCHLLCNTIVPWDNIRALLASRLIVLDKCPGVRPIGVGETLRRIVGKTICLVTWSDAAGQNLRTFNSIVIRFNELKAF